MLKAGSEVGSSFGEASQGKEVVVREPTPGPGKAVGFKAKGGGSQLEPVLQNLPTLLQIPPLPPHPPKVQRWKELAFSIVAESNLRHYMTPFNTV